MIFPTKSRNLKDYECLNDFLDKTQADTLDV